MSAKHQDSAGFLTAVLRLYAEDHDGRYERAHPDAQGLYHGAVLPDFRMPVAWLWQSPLPTLRQVLREWETP